MIKLSIQIYLLIGIILAMWISIDDGESVIMDVDDMISRVEPRPTRAEAKFLWWFTVTGFMAVITLFWAAFAISVILDDDDDDDDDGEMRLA